MPQDPTSAPQAPELTPEAAELGQDPAAVSDPDFEAVRAGIVEAGE